MSSDRASVRNILHRVKAEGRSTLSPDEGRILCEAYGISVPHEGIARTPSELSPLIDEIGFPLAMKVVSPDILHKTEARGVIVGVKTPAEAAQAFDEIIRNARRYKSDAKIDGVLVQQMLTEGHEVIIGALTDPSFGKVVAFGLGGVMVEVFKDVTFRLAPRRLHPVPAVCHDRGEGIGVAITEKERDTPGRQELSDLMQHGLRHRQRTVTDLNASQ